MIECNECKKEFGKEDLLLVCGNCDQPICPECKKDHDCLEDPDEHENETCGECGSCPEILLECPACSNKYCDDCIKEHLKEEREDIEFEEYRFGEYAKENIAKNL
jgi:hypothetical protein